jgi:hypothetical protein
MGQIAQAESRRHRRSNVFLTAALESGETALAVTLRNLSHDGALVQGAELPAESERIVFRRHGLSVPGRVAWTCAPFAGIAFESPLSPGELLRHVPAPGRRLAPPPMKRRPGFAAVPLTDAERAIIERWATESATRLGD